MKKLLLAFHEKSKIPLFELLGRARGYSVEKVEEERELISRATDVDVLKYAMDANLGNSNSPDFSPLQRMYESLAIRGVPISRLLLGISGNETLVELATKKGLPAVLSTNYEKIREFLAD